MYHSNNNNNNSNNNNDNINVNINSTDNNNDTPSEKDENNNKKLIIKEEENTDMNPSNSQELMDNVIYRLSLNPNKGGLQKVDKKKVDKIIYDISKGSAFFKNVQEKEKIHTERIKELKKKYSFLKKQNLDYEKRQMENLMNKMDEERDLSQYIVHVDMHSLLLLKNWIIPN
jgi:hypothetical protein